MNTASPLILKTMIQDQPEAADKILLRWHEKLQEKRDWRAELRRANTPEALLLCAGFRVLAQEFRPWLRYEWQWLGLALAAGAASHINTIDNKASFAAQLGSKEKNSKPVLSELRFARLQQAVYPEDFYRLIVRAVRQLDRQCNLLSLVDGILLWCREQDEKNRDLPFERSPFQRLPLRWATEYFQATLTTTDEE